MLDRIPMDVVNMRKEIRLVSDKMVPKPPLPKTALATFDAAIGYPLALLNGSGEIALYQTPPRGKISIVRRKRPNTVQMIRQDHDGFYPEAMVLADFDKGLPQYVYVAYQQAIALALGKVDSKEPCRTKNMNAAVICHG